MPVNAHPDFTFSSFVHNDWTQVQTDAKLRGLSEKIPSEKHTHKLIDALMIQTNGIDAFTPSYDDAEAHGGYDRQTPERFQGERDDSLMRSLINTYAIELKNKDGTASGNFFLDNSGAKEACVEVLKNNSHLTADKSANFMTEHFENTWNHFDVNKDGIVEVGRFP